ncbi:hypothetical protein EYF80_030661 [Liparis tanakae]|uniref:Uncharacterized protein n=1 Tax=Liparis tanakae TaxID=230148 RepID=A0A4Z2GZS5_9TELE|nr:hypothetical protein EYF80_030661 [Liparis tanakae]
MAAWPSAAILYTRALAQSNLTAKANSSADSHSSTVQPSRTMTPTGSRASRSSNTNQRRWYAVLRSPFLNRKPVLSGGESQVA